jgi:hypothetical protein
LIAHGAEESRAAPEAASNRDLSADHFNEIGRFLRLVDPQGLSGELSLRAGEVGVPCRIDNKGCTPPPN